VELLKSISQSQERDTLQFAIPSAFERYERPRSWRVDVEASCEAEGWELLPALDGTHHGEYSVLMRRVELD
jgi:hypothetical protein